MSAIAPSRAYRIRIEEAFGSLRRGPGWAGNIALGAFLGLLSFLVVPYFLVQGYLLTFTARVARVEATPLPEWQDWGELLHKGVLVAIVNFAYSLPYGLLVAIFYAASFALPIALAGAAPPGGARASDSVQIAAGVFTVFWYLLLFLTHLAITAILPAARAQLVLHRDELGAAFRPRAVFGFIDRHRGQYALATLLYWVATIAFAPLGYLACCIGVLVTTFLCELFLAHWMGQLCYDELGRRARPGPGTNEMGVA